MASGRSLPHMAAPVIHFAINADDIAATRAFYSRVCGWTFSAWGPPGFFQIDTGADGPSGALQQRRELAEGLDVRGFECTVGVDDVDAALVEANAAGGTTLMEPTVIDGVGRLAFAKDPSGNVVGLMEPMSTAASA